MSCHRSINHNAGPPEGGTPNIPLSQDTTVFVATNLTAVEAHFLGEIQALFCDPALAEKRRLVMEGQAVIWRDHLDRNAFVLTLDYLRGYFYRRFVSQFNEIPGPATEPPKEKGTS